MIESLLYFISKFNQAGDLIDWRFSCFSITIHKGLLIYLMVIAYIYKSLSQQRKLKSLFFFFFFRSRSKQNVWRHLNILSFPHSSSRRRRRCLVVGHEVCVTNKIGSYILTEQRFFHSTGRVVDCCYGDERSVCILRGLILTTRTFKNKYNGRIFNINFDGGDRLQQKGAPASATEILLASGLLIIGSGWASAKVVVALADQLLAHFRSVLIGHRRRSRD